MVAVVRFFGPNDPNYGFLSNFYEAQQRYRGHNYKTNEHFFQAMKAADNRQRRAIRDAATPAAAKRVGRYCVIRPDWEEIKPAIMYMGLRLKFGQHTDLATRLVETGDSSLVEANLRDEYWGIGTGYGTNQLGRLLELVRDDLREGTL